VAAEIADWLGLARQAGEAKAGQARPTYQRQRLLTHAPAVQPKSACLQALLADGRVRSLDLGRQQLLAEGT